MRRLTEPEVLSKIEVLSRAWEEEPTFLFLPEKAGAERAWVEHALSQVPKELETGHYALLTSGTTGAPKLIIGERRRSEHLAATLHQWQESEPVKETILALPLSYSYAFVNQWVWSRCFHRKLTLTAGLKEAASLRAALEQASQAMICLVGVQVPLLAACLEGLSFPNIIRVHFAGGRFPQENLPLVRALFPQAMIFNNYGCAEALPRLALRKAEAASEAANIGQPLPGIELAVNEAKELLFRSPFGAVGVIEDGTFTPIRPETWVKTGDLAEPARQDGWRLLGRAGEVFKRYGEKISLARLLTTVSGAWPGQAVFYRQADARGDEGHVLVLAPSPSSGQLQEVLQAFRRHHSRAHWPLRIESVAALPLLPNGKADVRAVALTDKAVLWRQRL
jgi:acyl-CoA synthetase (AMP-forming)/AMP-acid ligase II